jgi:hypothetical protein
MTRLGDLNGLGAISGPLAAFSPRAASIFRPFALDARAGPTMSITFSKVICFKTNYIILANNLQGVTGAAIMGLQSGKCEAIKC